MISTHKEPVLALDAKGLKPYQIQRRLNLSVGTVAGILYRDRNPYVPTENRRRYEKNYPHHVGTYLDDEMLDKFKEYVAEVGLTKSEVLRMLVTFGLESLEGE